MSLCSSNGTHCCESISHQIAGKFPIYLNMCQTLIRIKSFKKCTFFPPLPYRPIDSDENYFLRDSLRCGRILKEAGLQKWRWTGFNFGLDLIIISDTKTLSIKRHHRADYERLLSMQVKRTFLIRVTVSSLNDQRQTKHVQTTGITLVSLDKNEEVPLITLESQLEYPLLIAVNLLMSTNSALLRTSFCAAGPQMDLATFLANQQSKSSINLNSSTST